MQHDEMAARILVASAILTLIATPFIAVAALIIALQ
jgi:hypothetical protein